MHVVATAGHVDHGKSTIVRALTGMEPDRWAEERRRGMTIDLGFAWTTLPSGEPVAFVDVPGHERFVANMLAGVGPVPAVMLVVAADEGWMPQTDEHVQAIVAAARPRLLLVVSKADTAPTDAVTTDAVRRLAAAGFDDVDTVSVSAATGAGMPQLRAALDRLVAQLPAPDAAAPVRLWVDRAFTIRGAGTVVTGTLGAGRIGVGDTLRLVPGEREVVVRGLQSLNEDVAEARAVARVAVNLRGVERDAVHRGCALVTPRRWTECSEVDVVTADGADLPSQLVVHVGSAAVPAQLRPLGPGGARLRLSVALPLHLGDRLLLRDPGGRRVAGAVVADLTPRPLRRRGDAARVASALRVPASSDEVLQRCGIATADELLAAGLVDLPTAGVRIGAHWVAPQRWAALRTALAERVAGVAPLDNGLPLPAVARELDLPSVDLAVALAATLPDVTCVDGRVRPASAAQPQSPALQSLLERLRHQPFRAPEAGEVAADAIAPAVLSRAVRDGLLLRLTDGVYLGADAPDRAVELLRGLAEPFTVGDARTALGSSRRVVVPLLEHLDATRRTLRLSDGTRRVVTRRA